MCIAVLIHKGVPEMLFKSMDSGEVRVIGRATCKVTSMGSGRLVCEPAAAEAQPKDDKPKA